jgi:hypothetical protein
LNYPAIPAACRRRCAAFPLCGAPKVERCPAIPATPGAGIGSSTRA